MTEVDRTIAQLAEQQDGVVCRDQIAAVGLTDQQLRRRLESGRWAAAGAQAVRIGGAPPTYRGRVRAALLDAGPLGRASHGCACRLLGVPSFEAHPEVEILMPRSSDHRCTIGTVHESRRYDQLRTTTEPGLACVALSFALGQVAPVISTKRLAWIVEELVDARRLTIPSLAAAGAVLSPGNRGYRGLYSVLDEWSAADAIAESALERRFLAIAAAYDLPRFEQQVTFVWRRHAQHRVDFVWHDARVIVEVDGRRWHARRKDFDRDARRDLDAAAAGWQIIRLTWWMLDRDPGEVCASLLAARRARLAA